MWITAEDGYTDVDDTVMSVRDIIIELKKLREQIEEQDAIIESIMHLYARCAKPNEKDEEITRLRDVLKMIRNQGIMCEVCLKDCNCAHCIAKRALEK